MTPQAQVKKRTNGTSHESAPSWAHTLRRKRAISPDGTGIAYEVVGEGSKTLVLANGLGGRLYSMQPLVDAYWRRYRLITWDYRGLFESDAPQSLRRLAINHHAEDVATILAAESVDRAVLVGWSMGVQVSLEFASQAPGRVAGLVLINGTYGQVFSSGFQPWFSIPLLPKRLHAFVEFLRSHPKAADRLRQLTRLTEWPTTALMLITCGGRALELRPVLRQYYRDVLGPTFTNYMRLFQELDAHSMYHLLPEIDAPTLIISGALDMLTPAFQSRDMARRLPNSEHLALKRASHFAIVERPDAVVGAVTRFLDRRARL